jgi:hypothetical protein
MNEKLRSEFTKDELKAILHSFKKEKKYGHDGLIVEFYLVFYEFLKE